MGSIEHMFVAQIAAADAAIDGLMALDPAALDQDELARYVVAVHRLKARMDAVATRATGAFERHGNPQGAVGAASWVAWKCRIKRSEARAELSRARALRRMPDVDAAYESGAITSEHVRLLAAAHGSAPEVFEKVEGQLVEAAETQRFDRFRREVAYFRQLADPDGTSERAQDALERRNLHASRSFEDTVIVNGVLDPIGGTVYLNELRRLEQELFESDWREARERLGSGATATDLRRTPEQRRADAMVEMARRSAAMPAGARQARPLFTVHVGYETFHGMLTQLADGTVVCPEQLVPWLADTDVERVVFDGPSRVVDVGAKQRCFTGATRRAVEARDLFCTHESCDVPYERCDVDHIERYEHEGPTVQANGRVRCPHHNPGRRRPQRPPPPDDG
jgi:hypothetical protein